MRADSVTKVTLYVRVSTEEQETDNQLLVLREYCQRNGYAIVQEYVDKVSGGTSDRPQFKQMFIDAHRRRFDTLIFWSLDRLSREGVKKTLDYLFQLESYGINFVSYSEPYLNSTGIFRDVIISLLAVLARQERIRLSERVCAGLSRAKAAGVRLGKAPLPQRERYRIIEAYLKDPGRSIRQIADTLGMTKSSVHKLVVSVLMFPVL